MSADTGPTATARSGPVATAAGAAWAGRLRTTVWPNLPTLLVTSTVVSAAALLAMLVAPGITPASLLLWALLVAPPAAALVAQANDMVLGGWPRPFSVVGYVRRAGLLGLTVWLPPAVAGACAMVAVGVWERTREPLVLVSAAVGAVGAALLTIAALVAVPVGLERPGLRGARLTVTALHVAARRPVPVFAVAAFAVAAVSSAERVAASLVLLVPAPLALVLVAAVWTSAEAAGLRPAERES